MTSCRWHAFCFISDMAINFKKLQTWVAALAFACVMGTLSQSSALTIGDTRDLGLIDPNHPASPAASEDFIDILLDQPLNSGPTTMHDHCVKHLQTHIRGREMIPSAEFIPTADFAAEFGDQVTNINLGTGFLYLLAKYDGPNFGSVVWYVGGLGRIDHIPATWLGRRFAALAHLSLQSQRSAQRRSRWRRNGDVTGKCSCLPRRIAAALRLRTFPYYFRKKQEWPFR